MKENTAGVVEVDPSGGEALETQQLRFQNTSRRMSRMKRRLVQELVSIGLLEEDPGVQNVVRVVGAVSVDGSVKEVHTFR
jgi:hypothetical protein